MVSLRVNSRLPLCLVPARPGYDFFARENNKDLTDTQHGIDFEAEICNIQAVAAWRLRNSSFDFTAQFDFCELQNELAC